MNPNALKKKAKKRGKTDVSKLPDSFGFPGGKCKGGGYIRKLTAQETEAQRKAGAFINLNGKPFNGF